MEHRVIEKKLNREEGLDTIALILTRFSALITNLSTDPRSRLYDEKLIRIMYKLDSENYYLKVNQFFLSGEYDRLSSEGVQDLLLKMRELSQKFCLKVQIPADIEVIGDDVTLELNKIKNLKYSWKVYLNEDSQIKKVEYGSDKQKAQIIDSDGKLISEVEMVGKDYEGKGFAKKLLTAAGIKITKDKDLELQNLMLDGGLFYINKEEGWIEKEKYFERMTPKDFLKIQDYKDVTVKAVYEDEKGELTFTYTAGGKTKKLFVIKASNNQKNREWPTASGNNVFPSDAVNSQEKRKIEMKTIPDDGTTPVDYIPYKFPKGNWKITAFEKNETNEYGPYKIRTNAWREVEAWEEVIDPKTQKKKWRKKVDSNGNVVKTRDAGLLIHGGGWSESDLDNKKGSNKYTDTTLGCIRISNLDVLLIVKVLHTYLNLNGFILLEVK